MSSLVYVAPIGGRTQVRFTLPVKGVFGRVLCDTDGTIGYPTEFGPETALTIVSKCEGWPDLSERDRRRLRLVRRWAERGDRLFANWVH